MMIPLLLLQLIFYILLLRYNCETVQENSQNYAPVISTNKLPGLANLSNCIIKFDVKYNVIYTLVTSSKDSDISESTLYYSTLIGSGHHQVNIKHNKNNVTLSNIYVGYGVIIGYSNIQNILVVSFDMTLNWGISTISEPIKEVILSEDNSKNVAFIDIEDNLYLMSKDGSQWTMVSYGCSNPIWKKNSDYIYFTRYSYFSSSRSLYKANIDGNSAIKRFSNIRNWGMINEMTWLTTTDNDKLTLMISLNDKSFREAKFPKFLDKKHLALTHITSNEILVIVVNHTRDILLYSGSTIDLMFSLVSHRMGVSDINDEIICPEIIAFDDIPGLIIGNKYGEAYGIKKYTAISFTHGSKWTHIKPQVKFKNEICEWPSCYLLLEFKCSKHFSVDSFLVAKKSPYIMVSYGILYLNNSNLNMTGIFISSDAGHSWHMAKKEISKVSILNNGGLLVGLAENSHSIYYSYNYGITWMSSIAYSRPLIPFIQFKHSDSHINIMTMIAFDDKEHTWVVIKSDFQYLTDKECPQSFYELFSPGIHSNSHCFQGKKNFMYRRKHNAICQNIFDKLPKINDVACSCTIDDFGCSFGYMMNDGRCKIDPDYGEIEHVKECEQGKFHLQPSIIRKLNADKCVSRDLFKDQEVDICKFTNDDITLSVLIGLNIKYLQLTNMEPKLVNIPINLFHLGLIISYDFDFDSRCLYALNSSGIVEICYNTRELAYEHSENILLRLSNLKGFKMDQYTKNIFYYDRKFIFVMDIKKRYQKNLLDTGKANIRDFNVFPTYGMFTVVTSTFEGDIEKYIFGLYNIQGKLICKVNIPQVSLKISYDNDLKGFHIYSKVNLCVINTSCVIQSKSNHNIDKLFNIFIFGADTVQITENGIQIGSKFVLQHHIKFAVYHNYALNKLNHPCSHSECDMICLTISEDHYKCDCTEGSNFEPTIQRCVCTDPLASECLECKYNEFHCDNEKCLSLNTLCNGVDDCGDESDEKWCVKKCAMDSISCDNKTKCVEYERICDGNIDCIDRKDEFECHKIKGCSLDEFQCNNYICIPYYQYCDTVSNCEDDSDEDFCIPSICKPHETKCQNGQCIRSEQICNDIMDCIDFSDEVGCHGKTHEMHNISCLLYCDEKCVSGDKICNHITDCSNGKDESNCGYISQCQTKGLVNCESDYICYNSKFKCDGFTDCYDKSDEFGCSKHKTANCSEFYDYKCEISEECISINQYCDGNYDCEDKSDEGARCINNIYLKSLKIKKIKMNELYITWNINLRLKLNFVVFLITKLSGNSVTIDTNKKEHVFKNLVSCVKYEIMVKILGSNTGRMMQFTYFQMEMESPYDLSYIYTNKTLRWLHNNGACIPYIFYVECKDYNNKTIYRNFSDTNITILQYGVGYECQVSACPMKVYNISCSPFSHKINLDSYLPGYHKKSWFVVICANLISFVLLATIIYIFLKCKSKGISTYLKFHLPISYKNIKTSQMDYESLLKHDECYF